MKTKMKALKQQNTKLFQMEKTLIYAGAGWDAEFLRVFYKYTRYVLIDALPAKPHYEPGQHGYVKCHNQEAFFKTLQDTFGKFWRHDEDNKVLYFDRGVEYWYSCDAEDEDTISKLPDGDILVRGYCPKNWNELYEMRNVFLSCDTLGYIKDARKTHFHSRVDCSLNYRSGDDYDSYDYDSDDYDSDDDDSVGCDCLTCKG